MTAKLFYIYDTHCPWSYVTTPLVNEIAKAFPTIKIHLWHSARYDGEEGITRSQIEAATSDSNTRFGQDYIDISSQPKDSTIAANLMAWTQNKASHLSLKLLNALQEAHFNSGNELDSEEKLADIISQLKLSPPQKVFAIEKLTKEAEIALHDIEEFQTMMGTSAIPALLLAVEDNLVLLNHNLYLKKPQAIVEAVKSEMGE